MTDGWTSRPS